MKKQYFNTKTKNYMIAKYSILPVIDTVMGAIILFTIMLVVFYI